MRVCGRLGRVFAVFCATVALLALCAGAASAKEIHPLLGSFGSFSSVEGVAVDQATGDVYVYDGGNGEILKYDSSGKPAEFSATKSNAIIGVPVAYSGEAQIAVDSSTGPAKGDIYVVHGGEDVHIYSEAGAQIGELKMEPLGAPWGSLVCGVAVDPSGNLYLGIYEGYVDKFTPTANPVTGVSYVASLTGASTPCNIAADSAGNVFTIPYGGGPITRYDALQFGVPSAIGTSLPSRAGGLAIDPSTDDLYAIGNEGVEQSGPHGEPPMLAPFGPSGGTGIAVNGGTHDVYVGNGSGVVYIYGPSEAFPDVTTTAPSGLQPTTAVLAGTVNPQGKTLEECFFEYGETAAYGAQVPCAESSAEIGTGTEPVTVHGEVKGLTIDTAYHYRLVVKVRSNVITGGDATFTTPGSPLAQGTRVIAVRSTSAVVAAEIDPRIDLTHYRFEYGPTTAYGTSVPVPDASAGSGDRFIEVGAGIVGLRPGTTYHFRVVASNAAGAFEGPDGSFTTYGAQSIGEESCPNAAVRALQQSSYLPDCRAIELVSPVDKNGGDVAAESTVTQAAIGGNAIKYTSTAMFGDARGAENRGAEYIAERGSEGWSTHAVNPFQAAPAFGTGSVQQYEYFTPNLQQGVYYALSPVLTGYPNVEKNANLYLRTDALTAGAGEYQLLSNAVEPLTPRPGGLYDEEEVAFAGASSDTSHIIFESYNDLTASSVGLDTQGPKLYEWHAGTITLAGVLPNGEAAPMSVAGQSANAGVLGQGTWTESAISADGSKIVFEVPQSAHGPRGFLVGALYMRIDGSETIQLNASERTDCNVQRQEAEPGYKCTGAPEPDPLGAQPARFWGASEDGSKVFFTTGQRLTDDARSESLYMYDLDAPAGHRLTLISVDSNPGGRRSYPAAVVVPGISRDGAYVYFTSERPLRAGDPKPEVVGQNLYVWHAGQLRFIATRNEGCRQENPCWADFARESGDAFRVTPDGTTAVFSSEDPGTAERFGVTSPLHEQRYRKETYVYSYDSDRLACASCNRLGLPLSSDAGFANFNQTDSAHGYSLGQAHAIMYLNRPVSEDGRWVFFDTAEALVPSDTNGRRDVYEYDTATGEVHLLTSGTCNCDADFVDASADGHNVFFVTNEKLLAADQGTSADLYDVRIDGGFAAQSAASPAPCAGEECQPPGSAAPTFGTPSSASFVGEGDAAPVPAGKPASAHKQPAKPVKRCAKRSKHKRAKCAQKAKSGHRARRAAARAVRSVSQRKGRS